MRRDMLVEKARKIHTLHMREQQWDSICTFCFSFLQFFYAPSCFLICCVAEGAERVESRALRRSGNAIYRIAS